MTSVTLVPLWVELLVAVLLVISGLFALTGAIGLVRLKTFFQRMHPVALGFTLGAWSACAASIAYFSALGSRPAMHAWLIPIFLSITVPITSILLGRTGLFRKREAGDNVPPPLSRGAGELRVRSANRGKAPMDAGDDLP